MLPQKLRNTSIICQIIAQKLRTALPHTLPVGGLVQEAVYNLMDSHNVTNIHTYKQSNVVQGHIMFQLIIKCDLLSEYENYISPERQN